MKVWFWILVSAMAAAKADPLAQGFPKALGSWFELRSFEEGLVDSDDWPKTKYRILIVRPRKTGWVRFGYEYERRIAKRHQQAVKREFTVSVVSKGDARDLGPTFQNILALGDELSVPVPIEDPQGQGKMSALKWIVAREEPAPDLTDLSKPCEPPAVSVVVKEVSPLLGDAAFRCTELVRANLSTRRSVSVRLTAKEPGEIAAHRVLVVPKDASVSQPVVVWDETVTDVVRGVPRENRHSIHDVRADLDAWTELRPGDRIWLSAWRRSRCRTMAPSVADGNCIRFAQLLKKGDSDEIRKASTEKGYQSLLQSKRKDQELGQFFSELGRDWEKLEVRWTNLGRDHTAGVMGTEKKGTSILFVCEGTEWKFEFWGGPRK